MIVEKIHDRRATDLLRNARVVSAVVKDPYSTTGEHISVTRSVRDDPLADMLARRVIDQALFEAGRKWQRYHELTTIGPISAIDPSKEAVDGGRMPDPITDKQIDAFRKIAEADRMLGQVGSALMRSLLGEGKTVGQICDAHGCDTARKQNFMSQRIRECLNDLARHFGLAG